MSRYGFLLSRRWLGLAVIFLVIAVACVFLGAWQWSRHEDRSAANALVNGNYDSAPQPIEDVVSDAVPAGLVWRSVVVEGSYTGEQVVVRNRPVDGAAAARVLAVLEVHEEDDDGGRLVVVDRGWVPLGEGEPQLPDYPTGEVTLAGRLRAAEGTDERTAPAGQVYRIEPDTVAEAAGVEGGELFDGYLMATAEDGAPATGLEPFPRPDTSPGNHLSYAFQWWVFALGAVVGYVVLARREAKELGGVPERAAGPARTPRRRTDADEEDALIDAQLQDQ
ncbi:SURF1 family protein [Georgenia satyanarayanai]|uniref:SURF1 family cytochrome oxidase biogenesis protein n=1 Tax=Georgenia satyanarayanai TaxID=860221 RepID=UPI00203AB589|nr:SURF1 family protein [Georgenia satyanarayanai]MCM3662034.1 SURF1 family protein [Georgenia satyanarayanai]